MEESNKNISVSQNEEINEEILNKTNKDDINEINPISRLGINSDVIKKEIIQEKEDVENLILNLKDKMKSSLDNRNHIEKSMNNIQLKLKEEQEQETDGCLNEENESINNGNRKNNINDNYDNNKQYKKPDFNIYNYLDETEDVILSETQLSKLKEKSSIINKLKNTRLRKILKAINSSKFKKQMLEQIMKEDKHFTMFCDEILTALGFSESVYNNNNKQFNVINL